ncbi:MAG: TIGR02281 family clan AA aspartic protease [Pseudomonadales bacterium]|nr:TIGR02281 family clan AA aspartic protease [Pseudomonadales bacterium]
MSPPTPIPGRKIGKFMLIFAWILAIVLLTRFFGEWQSELDNPNQSPLTQTNAEGIREVKLLRNRAGHYVSNGQINGQTVKFLLDTGATDVVIPQKTADKLALEYGYASQANTANGVITVYQTELLSLQLGDIELTNVRASINPHMNIGSILLGMSALKQLELIQRDQFLTLRQHAPHD